MFNKEGAISAVFLFACAAVFPIACSREPGVKQMVAPMYPVVAQSNDVEGVVDLTIQVGVDGRVLSVSVGSEGSKANPDLIAAAKENAKQWVWGPFPAKFEFPWYHNIQYIYRLQGRRTQFPIDPQIVRTRLPYQVEIITAPCYKTYLEMQRVDPKDKDK